MSRTKRSLRRDLTVAVLLVGGIFLLRAHVLEWVLQKDTPLLYFLAAVILAAWNGGFRAGLLATVLSLVVSIFFFLPPVYSFAIEDLSHILRVPLFFASGVFVSWVTEAMRAARRRAEFHEQAIKAHQDVWRTTLSSIGDAVMSTDIDGRVTFLNTVAESLTGWTERDARGRPLDEVFRIIEENARKPIEQPAVIALQEGRVATLESDTLLVARDGGECLIEEVAAPINGSGLMPTTGVVIVFRDITERRRAEQDLRQMDRRKDEFLATLAHELRNPLAALQNAVSLMAFKRDDAAELADIERMMQRQVDLLVRLIDDLLDVSRISRGKITLKKDLVDLGSIVEQALAATRPLVDKFRHQLTVDQSRESLFLEVDAARVTQIVSNLLNNAAKYTPSEGHIRLTTESVGRHAVIRVKDNGIGIARDQLTHVFEMFTQLDESLDRGEPGLGIGLTLVKRLVELHDGSITVESDGLGRGAQFTVILPLASVGRNVPEAAPPERDRPIQAPRMRILVVDDAPESADLFVRLLRNTGHDVDYAENALVALDRIRRYTPDVVISDICMPGMNGYTLAAKLREQSQLNETYLVAITGYGKTEDKEQALKAGFDSHLVKPVDLAALQALLGTIGRRRSRQPV